MLIFTHPMALLDHVATAASIISAVLAAAAFAIVTWKRSAYAAEREIADSYREYADSQRAKALEMEERLHRLETRVQHLAIERDRYIRKQAAAQSEIEQFERILRILVTVRPILSIDTRRSIDRILGDVARSREEAASELFAWEQSVQYRQAQPSIMSA